MKEFLKKNWFVAVIAVLFLGFTVFFVYDQNKDILRGKTVNGTGVIFTVGDRDVTADEVFERYYAAGGSDAAYLLLQRQILDTAVETTDEMKQEASSMATSYLNYYTNYYGSAYAQYIIQSSLTAMGLDTLDEYCLYSLKQEQLDKDFVKSNLDAYWPDFAKEYTPRIVYHALVTMEDPQNPTEEEAAALKEAQDAWNSGEYTFEEFAKKYSKDTSSAVNGGLIGYIDKTSADTYVQEFVDNALKTEAGKCSEWFATTYGYHIIYVSSTDSADCLEDVSCLEKLLTMYPNMEKAAMWARMKNMNVKFNDADLETKIKEALSVGEDGEVEKTTAKDDE